MNSIGMPELIVIGIVLGLLLLPVAGIVVFVLFLKKQSDPRTVRPPAQPPPPPGPDTR